MRYIARVMVLILSVLTLTNVYMLPAYAITLEPNQKKLDQELLSFIKKSTVQDYTKTEGGSAGERKLDLTLPIGNYISIEPKLNMERFNQALDYLQGRLEMDEIELDLTYDHLTGKQKVVATSIRNASMMGLVVFAIIWAAPEEFSNWRHDDDDPASLFDRWQDNVSSKPVVDKDDPLINFIGHPISGAYEYLFLRNAGFSKLESFGFSVFMSTVIWEYGIEAFQERPSIQDLIVTPVLGSLLGELFHSLDKDLKDKNYVLLNSKRFGRLVHHFINPIDGINNVLDKVTALDFLHLDNAHFYVRTDRVNTQENDGPDLDGLSLGIKFKFTF